MYTEVEDSADDSLNWAEVGISTSCKAYDLTAYPILLVSDGEGGNQSLLDFFDGGCQ